jgi:serine/threonine protein kinase
MKAETDKLRETLVDQLSSFEDKLESKTDPVTILAEIQRAIDMLLGENFESESQIREVLQERYGSGDLRKETFELVRSIIDRSVTEQVVTSPLRSAKNDTKYDQTLVLDYGGSDSAAGPEPLESTVVIPRDAVALKPPKSDQAVQVGSVLRDRFMLQERVSGGSMGVVYKALDRRLAEGGDPNPWVAIKVLSSELANNGHALRALQQEAVKGRCLTHPNIVRFIDLDRDDDLYFIVMEWLEGRTLAEILDTPDTRSMGPTRALQVVSQIGLALDYAHRCGIVHADVKPGNVMILPNGDAKLFDFGVARVRQKTLQSQPDFDPGVLGLLTPAYSSMQVLTGEDPVAADDVFSLACLLYRLIAGYRVFGPRNAAEAADAGMKPERLNGVTDNQWRAIKKALSYSRVTRFDSMAEFIDALNAQVEEPVVISAPIRVEKPSFDDSPRRVSWVLVLVIMGSLLGVAEWRFGLLDALQQQFEQVEAIVTGSPLEEPAVFDPVPEFSAEALEAGDPEPLAEEIIDADEFFEADEVIEADRIIEAGNAEAGPSVATEPTEEATGIDFEEVAAEVAIENPADFVQPLIDFSTLPPPDAEVRLATRGASIETAEVRLREDGRPFVVDLVRSEADFPLTLKLEEVGFSGNRSPWVAGQYSFSDNGFVEFPVGQDRARIALVMANDPVREPDQQSTLRIREADSAASELAILNIILEDDDQRAFEATLPPNTVGFASSQVSVREQDPAVQIDILRFNPDDTALVVAYVLRDITATQGEDYFAPGNYTVEFGPGQRSARLLIPLVQDSAFESNEAFSVELIRTDSEISGDVYFRTAVLIRDDDT